jgi:hypothetical protein
VKITHYNYQTNMLKFVSYLVFLKYARKIYILRRNSHIFTILIIIQSSSMSEENDMSYLQYAGSASNLRWKTNYFEAHPNFYRIFFNVVAL